ncbi:MAG: site-specific DNA-methyltransferase, partial [Synergistaceae bacterium]|nr:site-specific DNA-methyltransferase [Synergistaceae bacterium]
YGIKYGSNFQPFINKRDVKDKNDDDLTTEPETIKAFRDTWELGIHSYLNYLRNRLLLVRELLTDSGSVFIQISDENVHHVREICDEIFGPDNFVSLITFRKTSPLTTSGLGGVCDYIIWYAKDKTQMKYHDLYVNKDAGEGTLYTWLELEDGTRRAMTNEERKSPKNYPIGARPFRFVSLSSVGYTQSCMYDFEFEGKIFKCGKKSWKTNQAGMQRLIEAKRIMAPGQVPSYVRYHDDFSLQSLNNLWDDTGGASNMVYVVQTSTKVIQRCILMTTDPNDLVLDITCGSGTTAYVAEQWGRRWITCDTSRVAIAIARQRLLTAVYDYYTLADPHKGISAGFVYKTVPHVTLKSIANNETPEQEILYDQPVKDNKKIRVTGAFNVEALPAPVVFSPEEAANIESNPNEAAKFSDWCEQLKATGIQGTHGEKMNFSSIEIFSGAQYISAEAYTDEGKHVFISFANESSLMDSRRVYESFKEAHKFPHDVIIYAAFQFDPAALEMINTLRTRDKTRDYLVVNMNTDLMTQDLRRKLHTDSLFWFVGQPDIMLEKLDSGKYRVKVLGFDYYNVSAGRIESGNTDKIAMWLLDSDYNGMTLNPTQIFFPIEGKTGGWAKLAKTLKTEINSDLIENFSGIQSLEFDAKENQQIAVKIIDDRGIESMKVLTVGQEAY